MVPVPDAVRGVCVFCRNWVTLEWSSKVMESRRLRLFFQTQLIPQTTPVDDHETNGVAKAMVHSLEGLTRVVRFPWRELLGSRFRNSADSAVVGEAPELSQEPVWGEVKRGKTPFEELSMSKLQSPLLYFGAVLAEESGAQGGQTALGLGCGHLDGLMDTRTLVIRARTVKRPLGH